MRLNSGDIAGVGWCEVDTSSIGHVETFIWTRIAGPDRTVVDGTSCGHQLRKIAPDFGKPQLETRCICYTFRHSRSKLGLDVSDVATIRRECRSMGRAAHKLHSRVGQLSEYFLEKL